MKRVLSRLQYKHVLPGLLFAYALYYGRASGFIGWMLIAYLVGRRMDYCRQTGEPFWVPEVREKTGWRRDAIQMVYDQLFFNWKKLCDRVYQAKRIDLEGYRSCWTMRYMYAPMIGVIILSHAYLLMVMGAELVFPEATELYLEQINQSAVWWMQYWRGWRDAVANLAAHGYAHQINFVTHVLLVQAICIVFVIYYGAVIKGREFVIVRHAYLQVKYPTTMRRSLVRLRDNVLVIIGTSILGWFLWRTAVLVLDFGQPHIARDVVRSFLVAIRPGKSMDFLFPVTFGVGLAFMFTMTPLALRDTIYALQRWRIESRKTQFKGSGSQEGE